MSRVLVTDGRQRSTLAVVRSLGQSGHEVVVGEDSFGCIAASSKYCSYRFQYISPVKSPKPFVESLLRELERQSYDMLIPMTDITAMLVMAHKDKFEELTNIPMPSVENYNRAIDKGELVKLCQSLAVPVPETHFIDSADQLETFRDKLHYPLVMKPRQSKYLIGNKWIQTDVCYIHSFDELQSKFSHWPKNIPYPMLQTKIVGSGEGAFMLYSKGKLITSFFHRRLREKPPSGGVSTLRESIAPNRAMMESSSKLLNALNWNGVAMVEFKYDKCDQIPKVMEINARFWGSLQLSIDAGINFPCLLNRTTMDEVITELKQYRLGVKSRWFWGDLDSLLIRLTNPVDSLNLSENDHGLFRSICDFLKLWQSNTKYEILRIRDLGPFLEETFEWLKMLIIRKQ